MIILGLTGTLGAGKGTVVEYLKEKGFAHFSARAYLQEEIARRGLPNNRDSMVTIGNEFREKFLKHATNKVQLVYYITSTYIWRKK